MESSIQAVKPGPKLVSLLVTHIPLSAFILAMRASHGRERGLYREGAGCHERGHCQGMQ
jgi:hypothetical protein